MVRPRRARHLIGPCTHNQPVPGFKFPTIRFVLLRCNWTFFAGNSSISRLELGLCNWTTGSSFHPLVGACSGGLAVAGW